MEESTPTVSRKVVICVRNGCTLCWGPTKKAPADCPYLILHALSTDGEAIQRMPRQSGKTTSLVKQANELLAFGESIYMVTFSAEWAERMHYQYGLDRRVKSFSYRQVKRGAMTSQPPGYVLSDELTPGQLFMLRPYMERHGLVAAYYT